MTVQISHEYLDALNQCIQESTGRTAVLLCADRALLMRLARRIMRQDRVTAQDVEDVATEYFNVVCGRISAGIYRLAHISSRFQVPRFRTGRYRPEELTANHCILHYTGGKNENAQLVFIPLTSQGLTL